jgi:hypothetical protein
MASILAPHLIQDTRAILQSPHPRVARPLPQAGEVLSPHPRVARPLPQAGEVLSPHPRVARPLPQAGEVRHQNALLTSFEKSLMPPAEFTAFTAK